MCLNSIGLIFMQAHKLGCSTNIVHIIISIITLIKFAWFPFSLDQSLKSLYLKDLLLLIRAPIFRVHVTLILIPTPNSSHSFTPAYIPKRILEVEEISRQPDSSTIWHTTHTEHCIWARGTFADNLHLRRSKAAVWQQQCGNGGIAAHAIPTMNRLEDDRYAGHQALFSISSMESFFPSRHITYNSQEMRVAATITKSQRISRPGRRRRSVYRVPLSLTTILLSIVMTLSMLCKPTEAAHDPGSQSRAVKGHFVDGRIMFDRNLAPRPELRRRDDQTSTDTASATTTPEVAGSSSSSDATTTTTLPTAFDGGFGTNYTQPSCPTFLRSMISNATFASCVPFSLLLQVCRSSPLPSKKIPIPNSLTFHPPEFHVLLRRDPVPLHHHRRPQRLVLRLLPHLLLSHVFFRPHPPLQQRLPGRLQQPEPAGAPSLRRPPRLRRLPQRLLPQRLPGHTRQRPVGNATGRHQRQQLLLRQRHHQQIRPDGQLHLLPPPRHHPPLRQPAHLQPLPRKHNGPLRHRRLQQDPTPQPRLRPIRHAHQRDVRARLRQRERPVRPLLFFRRREEILRRAVEGTGGVVVRRAGCGGGDDDGVGGGFVRAPALNLCIRTDYISILGKRCIYDSHPSIYILGSFFLFYQGGFYLWFISDGAGTGESVAC